MVAVFLYHSLDVWVDCVRSFFSSHSNLEFFSLLGYI